MDTQKPIIIFEHNDEWKSQFDLLRLVYLKHLGRLIISVEHVGSTAVPGLCAKPVLDIDIVIKTEDLARVTETLVKLGYGYMGEVAIPERFVFRQMNPLVPVDDDGRLWPKHHLYCCIEGSAALRNHLILRDALIENSDMRIKYGELKKQLALTSATMDEYVMGKTAFITSILAEKGMTNDELSAIVEQNKSVIPSSTN